MNKTPNESWPTPFWTPAYDAFYTSIWWKYKIPIIFQLGRLVLKIIGRYNSKIPTMTEAECRVEYGDEMAERLFAELKRRTKEFEKNGGGKCPLCS